MTGNASPVWLSYVGPELCSEPLVAFRLLSVAVLVGWAGGACALYLDWLLDRIFHLTT